MFDDTGDESEDIQAWLDLLRQAEPGTQRGALTTKNLEEDGNVPDEKGDALRAFVQGANEPHTPDEAARIYDQALDHLDTQVAAIESLGNDANRHPSVPFGQLARVVDFASFLTYNFLKLDVTLAELRRTVFVDQMAKRVMGPGFDIGELRNKIGKRTAWATRDETLKSADGSTISSDDLRDSLGLDDRLRYGAGKRMVYYIYSSERVPDEAFYRPTVLDTGWHGAAVAFLPSDPTVHETGITQHLRSGDRCAPEVIHEPFAANEVERVEVTEPLVNDPATGYRAIRLAN